jgi:hypothetical protein
MHAIAVTFDRGGGDVGPAAAEFADVDQVGEDLELGDREARQHLGIAAAVDRGRSRVPGASPPI